MNRKQIIERVAQSLPIDEKIRAECAEFLSKAKSGVGISAIIEYANERKRVFRKHIEDVLNTAGFFELLEAAGKTREHLKEECKIFGHDCDNCMNETCLGLRDAIAKITGGEAPWPGV